jgi:large subunit ribosomal protein L1
MDTNKFVVALKKAKEVAQKRNFTQSIDLIINLRDIDLKKPEHQVDFYAQLHNNVGKKVKVAGFIGPEGKDDARKVIDFVLTPDDFSKYKDKKNAKKLANEYTYFISQANIMPQVAGTFGKILGTRGKMPNPKAGCVVPPKANLRPLYEKLQKTVRVKAKVLPVVQCAVGTEDMKDEAVLDNIVTIYNQLVQNLPNHENNIDKILIKLSMGKVVVVE